MTDHSNQSLSRREMVRTHAYPVLATVSSLSLIGIVLLLLPQSVRHQRFNRYVDAQIEMRDVIDPRKVAFIRQGGSLASSLIDELWEKQPLFFCSVLHNEYTTTLC